VWSNGWEDLPEEGVEDDILVEDWWHEWQVESLILGPGDEVV
jgi:hypothetical protein